MQIPELIDKDIQTISLDANFNELIDLVRIGKRNMIAVIGNSEQLEGGITIDNIRPFISDKEPYQRLSVQQLMVPLPLIVE